MQACASSINTQRGWWKVETSFGMSLFYEAHAWACARLDWKKEWGSAWVPFLSLHILQPPNLTWCMPVFHLEKLCQFLTLYDTFAFLSLSTSSVCLQGVSTGLAGIVGGSVLASAGVRNCWRCLGFCRCEELLEEVSRLLQVWGSVLASAGVGGSVLASAGVRNCWRKCVGFCRCRLLQVWGGHR